MNKYYYLSNDEYKLLSLFGLTRFVNYFPGGFYDSFIEDIVIPYSRIDLLSRVVYAMDNKRCKDYKKLISFVERLQDILEKNPDIC